jgi:hypothetical protein
LGELEVDGIFEEQPVKERDLTDLLMLVIEKTVLE